MSEEPKGKDQKTKEQLTVRTSQASRRLSASSTPSGGQTSSSARSTTSHIKRTSSLSRTLSPHPKNPEGDALGLPIKAVCPKRSPIKTRSVKQPSSSIVAMALSQFISATDKVVQFEARVNSPVSEEDSFYTFEIRRDRLETLWDKVEAEYVACSTALNQEEASRDIASMETKYEHSYSVYERCLARLKGQIKRASVSERQEAPAPSPFSGGCRLPPCDTEIFHGDYLRWPTSSVSTLHTVRHLAVIRFSVSGDF